MRKASYPNRPSLLQQLWASPHLSSECLSLLQRLQLNINSTTAGEAIKIEGVLFQKGTPNKDEDKDGYPNECRGENGVTQAGNPAPCQGAGASFLRGLRLLYQTCTDWIATAGTVEVSVEQQDQKLTWINNTAAKDVNGGKKEKSQIDT